MSFIEMELPFAWNLNEIKEGTRILLVIEYPSNEDFKAKKGLSDGAGTILAQCLGHANMSLGECSVAFVIREPCTQATVNEYWTPKHGFTVKGAACVQELKEVIENCTANVIVPLGEIALHAVCGRRSITKLRGSILESTLVPSRKCIPSIDPRTAMRQYLCRYHISSDMRKVKVQSMFPEIKLPQRNLQIFPTFEQVIAYLRLCKEKKEIAYDIETFRNEVSAFGIAISPYDAMSIPMDNETWTIEEEAEIWLHIASILEDPTIAKITQNGIAFDNFFLLWKNSIISRGPQFDTLIMQSLNYPDFPKGLDFITSIYTDEPYYKDEGKTWFKELKSGKGDISIFYRYNCKDCCVTFESYKAISKELVQYGNIQTYLFNQRLAQPLTYMMLRGILVDAAKLAEHREEAKKTKAELQKELTRLCGFALNPSSPKQCKEYFYGTKKYKPITKRVKDKTTGERKESITCDEKALIRIARKYNSAEAKLCIQIRGYTKLIGTYLEVKYDADGRLRCTFKIGKTNTGRLSSSETIFDTGTNLQNLPKEFKEFLVADPGHIMCELDKAQAEWVAVAYISGDANMIEAVENRLDAHIHTARLMYGAPKDLIEFENKVIGSSTDADDIRALREEHCPDVFKYNPPNSMSMRQAGKKCNHSLNYGLSPQGFSLQYDMDLPTAKRCYNLYHSAYPGLKLWHRHIQNKLSKDRTLENLFGRKRRFLNRWNEDLFKAAYAYQPQSTIGELLNRGLDLNYAQQTEEGFEYLLDWDLLNQVHDSELFQYPEDNLYGFAQTIHRSKLNLEPKLKANGREFIIRTDAKIGYNAKKMVDINIEGDVDFIYQEVLKGVEKLKAMKPTTVKELVEEMIENEEENEELENTIE